MVPTPIEDLHLRLPIPARYFSEGGPLTVRFEERDVRVNVPAGLEPGMMLRLLDAAQDLIPGRPGHILLQLESQDEQRPVQDFRAGLTLERAEAQEGCVRKLILGDRRVRVKIPPGVSEGQQIRLRGAASYIDPYLDGDVYLVVDIEHTLWDRLGDAVSWVSAFSPDEVELSVPIPIFVKASLAWKLKKTTVKVSFG